MTESMRTDYSKHPRRPLRIPFQLITGEITAERFKRCDEYLNNDGAHMFFRTGRLSLDGKIHIGVFKKAIGRITLDQGEIDVYQPWQSASRDEVIRLGQTNSPLSEGFIHSLRQQADPAVHIMDELDAIRARSFPDVEADIMVHELVGKVYGLVLSSIHGSPESKQ